MATPWAKVQFWCDCGPFRAQVWINKTFTELILPKNQKINNVIWFVLNNCRAQRWKFLLTFFPNVLEKSDYFVYLCIYFLILNRGNFIVKLWFGCHFFLGAKLSVLLCWCQIVLVPNCPVPNCPGAKLSWCQIVRCQIVRCQIVLPPYFFVENFFLKKNFQKLIKW